MPARTRWQSEDPEGPSPADVTAILIPCAETLHLALRTLLALVVAVMYQQVKTASTVAIKNCHTNVGCRCGPPLPAAPLPAASARHPPSCVQS